MIERYDYSSGFFISKEKTGSALGQVSKLRDCIYLFIVSFQQFFFFFTFGALTTDLMDRLIHSVGALPLKIRPNFALPLSFVLTQMTKPISACMRDPCLLIEWFKHFIDFLVLMPSDTSQAMLQFIIYPLTVQTVSGWLDDDSRHIF